MAGKTTVCIIGAGWYGTAMAQGLEGMAGLDVVVVERKKYFVNNLGTRDLSGPSGLTTEEFVNVQPCPQPRPAAPRAACWCSQSRRPVRKVVVLQRLRLECDTF